MPSLYLNQDTILYLRSLQRSTEKADLEFLGAFDFDERGDIERIHLKRGTFMELLDPDFEVNFHTHPDGDDTYPDHPSYADAIYVLLETGQRNNAQMHLVVTPNFIYTLAASSRLRKAVNGKGDAFLDAYKERVVALWDECALKVPDRGQHEFRRCWVEALRTFGFDVEVYAFDDLLESDGVRIPLRDVVVKHHPLEHTGTLLFIMSFAIVAGITIMSR